MSNLRRKINIDSSNTEIFTTAKPATVDLHPSNKSAFGTIEASDLTPVFQSDFVYGLNTQKWRYSYVFTVTSPGSPPTAGDIYSNNNGYFVVVYSSGTTLVCFGTNDPAASGNLVRVSGAGTDPIAFSAFTTQVGVTNGTGASVDTDGGRLRIQSGTSATGYAYIMSRRPLRYRPGQGNVLRFTPIFTAGVADNIQIWGIGIITNDAVVDGYFVGYNGTSFGICRYNGGSPNWTYQASFNGDTLDGNGASGININKTYGTPWMIKYPFLGFGDIFFYAQNPTTGEWILAHVIRYANTTNAIQISNPTLTFMGYTLNSGNTSNMTMYCGSVGAFISGIRTFVGNARYGIDNSKTGITAETNIVTLKNAITFNTVANKGLMRLQSLSLSATAVNGTTVTVRLKTGVVLGGTPAFSTINGTTADNGCTITSGNSIATYDTAGTTVTGGNYIYNINCSAGNNGSGGAFVDLIPYEIFIAPGEQLTISASSANNAGVGISVNWSEDI